MNFKNIGKRIQGFFTDGLESEPKEKKEKSGLFLWGAVGAGVLAIRAATIAVIGVAAGSAVISSAAIGGIVLFTGLMTVGIVAETVRYLHKEGRELAALEKKCADLEPDDEFKMTKSFLKQSFNHSAALEKILDDKLTKDVLSDIKRQLNR